MLDIAPNVATFLPRRKVSIHVSGPVSLASFDRPSAEEAQLACLFPLLGTTAK
jgi:hypothetical protein